MLLNKRLPLKYILSGFLYEALFVVLLGVTFFTLNFWIKGMDLEIPLSIPAFLGTAISVLLSFKMSQSYERWWEARKIWGAIVNDSRTLIIQLQSFLLDNTSDPVVRRIAHRQIGWCYCLGESLRGLPTANTLSTFLSPEDVEELKSFGNKSLGIIQLNAKEIRALRQKGVLDSINHIQLDNTLLRLCESMGQSERIKNTVFPPKYRLVLKFTIYLFSVLLSISIKDFNPVIGLIVMVMLSSILFLLENIAFTLQDPFNNNPSDTAVTSIARTIEINIKQLIGDEDVPEPLAPKRYYIL